jgi:hypothetical protein
MFRVPGQEAGENKERCKDKQIKTHKKREWEMPIADEEAELNGRKKCDAWR